VATLEVELELFTKRPYHEASSDRASLEEALRSIQALATLDYPQQATSTVHIKHLEVVSSACSSSIGAPNPCPNDDDDENSSRRSRRRQRRLQQQGNHRQQEQQQQQSQQQRQERRTESLLVSEDWEGFHWAVSFDVVSHLELGHFCSAEDQAQGVRNALEDPTVCNA
jgi:hypothetical protein